ncbi:MAG: hypothetical protein H0U23_17980 [Blastocatellia bacterium]|nr:hypothetical protein [Blastocatellia bacterium]
MNVMGTGMNKAIGKAAHAKAVTALDRIGNLETIQQTLIDGVGKSFDLVEQRLQRIEELLSAVANTVGPDAVRDQLALIRKENEEAQLKAGTEAVEKAVAEGKLIKGAIPSLEVLESEDADSITSKTLVIGREFDKDGNVMAPGRLQLPLSKLTKEIQVALAYSEGDLTIETPNGGKFTLDAVYVEAEATADAVETSLMGEV